MNLLEISVLKHEDFLKFERLKEERWKEAFQRMNEEGEEMRPPSPVSVKDIPGISH